MERIKNLETKAFLEKILDYTPEERAKIDSIAGTKTMFFWHPIIFTQDDVDRTSTKAGITRQIDDFTLRVGLIYYARCEPDKPVLIERIAIEI